MAVDLLAVGVVLSYLVAVVCVGAWYGRKFLSGAQPIRRPSAVKESQRRRGTQNPFLQKLVLDDCKLPLAIGICSMTATWVGGVYLNETAEAVYTRGVLYCQAPISYAISLILGGCFFAQKMRETNALTMVDPFQAHYGRWMGLLLCLPAVCGEICWTAAWLAVLGAAASVIMEMDSELFVVVAATATFFYTALGGFYSVTYTDVLQIGTTAACLWMCVPYVSSSPAVGAVDYPQIDWIGSIERKDVVQLLDAFLMTSLGGIAWQVYFQRILSCESHFAAQMLSFVAGVGCVFMAIPAAFIGAAAKNANFTAAGYRGPWMLREHDSVLPHAIRYLTPASVSAVGMVGITAAVMSSADSSMLSASAMVTKNIYLVLLRPTASDMEVVVVLRFMVCLIGALSTYMALSVQSVYELWTLCLDAVYVLLFPQLVCVFYIKDTNTYGSIMALFLGAISRWLCGDPFLSMPLMSHLPIYDPRRGQRFPLRLACMALGLSTLVLGSLLAATAFRRQWLPAHYDVFGCFPRRKAAHDPAKRGAGGGVVTGHEQPKKVIRDSSPVAQKHARQSIDGGGRVDNEHARHIVSGGGPADQKHGKHIAGDCGPPDHEPVSLIAGRSGPVDRQPGKHIVDGAGPDDHENARRTAGSGRPMDREHSRPIIDGGGSEDYQSARHIVGGGSALGHESVKDIDGSGSPADIEHSAQSVRRSKASKRQSDASDFIVQQDALLSKLLLCSREMDCTFQTLT